MKRLPLLRAADEIGIESANRAATFEAQTFADVSREGGRVTCTKGCASCCYYPINISVLEGAQLYESLRDQRLWTPAFKQSVLAAHRAVWGLTPEIWLLSLVPCPVLKDNRCSAYEARPLTCRTIYAKTDPHFCHPHLFTSGQGLIDRRVVLGPFAAIEDRILKSLRLNPVRLPIATALVLAERVISEQWTGDEANRFVFDEWLHQLSMEGS